MTRTWIGLALLASSWTIGLGYYAPASWWLWAVLIALGTASLDVRAAAFAFPSRAQRLVAAVMLLPAAVFWPWPYAMAAVLMIVGLTLDLTAIPRDWPKAWARKAFAAGAALLVQAGVMAAYAHCTARSHDLPGPIAWLLGQLTRLAGADVAVSGDTLALRAGDRVVRVAATWDLLVDPATLCFLAAGLVVLGLTTFGSPVEMTALPTSTRRRRWRSWLSRAGALTAAVAAWLPLRACLMLGLLLQRELHAEPGVPSAAMGVLLSWWIATLLLAGPVLLAAWWGRPMGEAEGEPTNPAGHTSTAGTLRPAVAACAMVALGAAALVFFGLWEPVGKPKGGRVMVVERHSKWEPTDVLYDEDHYGETVSYTYSVIYDYAARRFTMSRLLQNDAIDAESLDRCDVLVVKIPTERFTRDETDAIERFVRRGGGLLLIGDHTNVFRSTTYLNDLARRFGFAFRDDLLFRVGTPYEEPYAPPRVPHPAVARLDAVDFAVSCSIDPGASDGRAAIQSPGLWSLPSQYENANYHPPAEYRPEMRFGAFIQLWAARHGSGRVLAFTDSTIFSNFSIFQPGKAELFFGMLDWLNRESAFDRELTRTTVELTAAMVGLALVLIGLFVGRRGSGWVVLIAAGVLGGTVSAATVAGLHRAGMPPTRPVGLTPDGKIEESKSDDGRIDVVIDRTLSDAPLALGAYNQGDGRGFGLLEQWIPRLGCFTARGRDAEAFSGDALIVLEPTRSIDPAYADRLARFVENGGRLIVFDSPDNANSTADTLLSPFGLGFDRAAPCEGEVTISDEKKPARLAGVPALPVLGGRPIAMIGDEPVASQAAFGRGTVTAIGFGSTFRDAPMGRAWSTLPDAPLRARFDFLYWLLRESIEP